ncbi:MAG: hypothetical protein HKN33_17095, partial [Pyrinomonadaceae bacterium]|nr:hypothetical protein [Pyrinomonadaceae bacterium]
RLDAAGAISLGKDLDVGGYILQVLVTETRKGKKPHTESQWVEFEIVR